MSHHRFLALSLTVCAAGIVTALSTQVPQAQAVESDPRLLASTNPAGQLRTFNVNGGLDLDNPFFQDLGTNGRRCVTCHQPREAWSITPEGVQARFAVSHGADPIFSNNDGSNCEGATTQSEVEQRNAYSLLLTRGLVRVGLDVPHDAEFVVESVADPYGCAFATNDVSVYRRPLPTTNLPFLSAVMWDGRESVPTSRILEDLARQANDATRGHAASARDLTVEEVQQIVSFETGLFSAQAVDTYGGSLQAHRGGGGPIALSRQEFFIGINDPVGLNPSSRVFDGNVFTLFDAWAGLPPEPRDQVNDARRAIVRGQQIFNTRPFTISGVGGLNGQTFASGVSVPASFTGTCTVCHDTPNAGNHSVKAPLDIGLTRPAVAPYLPIYTLRHIATGERVDTTDPGRALITGKWRDIGTFKGPILRALAARPRTFTMGPPRPWKRSSSSTTGASISS